MLLDGPWRAMKWAPSRGTDPPNDRWGPPKMSSCPRSPHQGLPAHALQCDSASLGFPQAHSALDPQGLESGVELEQFWGPNL